MTSVFINEIHYDNASTDSGEAIEIIGPAGTDLSGWTIVLYNGNNGTTYDTRALSGVLSDLGTGFGTFVLEYSSNGIQNGAPDGIALVNATGEVVQFLSYEGTFAAVGGPADGMTSTDIGVSETNSTVVGSSLQLIGDGTEAEDFTWSSALDETFGAVNSGQTFGDGTAPAAEARINEFHYDNASTDIGEAIEIRVTAGTDLTGWSIELYNGINGESYGTLSLDGLSTDDSGDGYAYVTLDAPGMQNGAPDGLALVDDAGDVVEFLSYEGTMTAADGPAAGMTSTDIMVTEGNSTPAGSSLQRSEDGTTWTLTDGINTFGAANAGGTTDPGDGEPVPLLISQIQGTGSASLYDGDYVVVSAVVTYTTSDGFYLQEEMGDYDADAMTSEGIFVYTGSGYSGSVGDQIEVTGTIDEFNGLTEITDVTELVTVSTGNVLPDYTEITLPKMTADIFEAVEGMRVSLTSSTDAALTVIENYNLARYGEVVISAGTQKNPTQIYDAQDDAAEIAALSEANTLNRLIIDDGNSNQNPSEIPYIPVDAAHDNGNGYLDSGDTFDADGPTLRLGAEMDAPVDGIMSYGFGDYRMLLDGTLPIEESSNEGARTDAPADVGGDLRVASFNTLNYFTSLDGRGATTEADLMRQTDKLVTAITALDADVVGLQELENNGFGNTSAISTLVDALNAKEGDGTYGYVDLSAFGDAEGRIGTDAITVGFIYRTDAVSVTGSAVLDDPAFTDPLGTGEQKNRPSVAVTFEDMDGEAITIVNNHFKSKGEGSASGLDADQGDGQGAWNATRTAAANALTEWLASDPTGSGDPDRLMLGDFNSYSMEDPIQAILSGADHVSGSADDYTDLIDAYIGRENAYSYVFDGQQGVLDQAIASGTLSSQVTGVAEWHINADEPGLLSYSSQFTDPAFYSVDPYSSSDHDPVVIGLDLSTDDGFESVAVNDWFNPAWGGGFNATFTYTLQENDLIGGDVRAWQIAFGYEGAGEISSAWMQGYNGSVSIAMDDEGELVLTSAGGGYKPVLEAGDTITFTVQVNGAGFSENDFALDFRDVDHVPTDDVPPVVEIDAAPTNDWGSGFNQSVSLTNEGDTTIDGWVIELDVEEGVTVNVSNVWGATVSTDADGDLIFRSLSWNSTLATDGSANFGFNASYSGTDGIAFDDSDFRFVTDDLLIAA